MPTPKTSLCEVLFYLKHARNPQLSRRTTFHSSSCASKDPRLERVGRLLEDEYSAIRSNYGMRKTRNRSTDTILMKQQRPHEIRSYLPMDYSGLMSCILSATFYREFNTGEG